MYVIFLSFLKFLVVSCLWVIDGEMSVRNAQKMMKNSCFAPPFGRKHTPWQTNFWVAVVFRRFSTDVPLPFVECSVPSQRIIHCFSPHHPLFCNEPSNGIFLKFSMFLEAFFLFPAAVACQFVALLHRNVSGFPVDCWKTQPQMLSECL